MTLSGEEEKAEVGPIREYRKCWQIVAAFEAAEQRGMSVAARWQQLNSIIALAEGLGLDWRRQDQEEVAGIRRRWVRLKEAQGGRNEG